MPEHQQTVSGRVTAAGQPLAGVAVSDGFRVVTTGDDGAFELPVDSQSGRFVFITTPGGYWTERWFVPADQALRDGASFELTARAASRHTGLYVTDLHLCESDANRARERFQATLDEIESMEPAPAFVLFGGDICLHNADGAGATYDEMLRGLSMPVRQAVGNHEADIEGDEPFAAFEERFGPRAYSFDIGEVHYVVLSGMVVRPGYSDWRAVQGHVDERELHWLTQDLGAAGDRPVVVFIHVPLVSTYAERRGSTAAAEPWWVVDNADEVIAVLAAHDTRFVLQGHLHENERLERDGIEFVETVSVCGRWWSMAGPEMGVSGEPRGYRRIDADGAEVSHRFVSTAEAATDAVGRLHVPEVLPAAPVAEVWVNVFDAAPDTRVSVRVDGGRPVPALPEPFPGTLQGGAFGWGHHFVARLDSAEWQPGERRRLTASVESRDTTATLERDVRVGSAELVRGRIIATKGDEAWMGIPGIECAPSGVLWGTAYTGGPKEPDEANRLVVFTSDDNGVRWSAPRTVIDPEGPTRAYDPTLWLDPRGRLWLIHNRSNPKTAEHEVWAAVHDQPDHPMLPFGKARRLNLGVEFAFRMNKPIVTSWGEWVMPVTWADQYVKGWWPSEGSQLQGVAISADEGGRWTLFGAVEAPHWALENMVVERRDGSLWMLIRAGGGGIWESVSTDRGRTWSDGRPTDIANPGSRFYIGRLASGRLLLVNSPDPTRRVRITAQLSDDDGHTWSKPLVLDDRSGTSYPDACQVADGRIFVVHDHARAGAGETVLSVFREIDVLGRE